MMSVYRNFTLIFLLCLTFCVGCDMINGNYVEQRVEHGIGPLELCNCGTSYSTYVWYNREIVKCWWDNGLTITDSLKKARRLEGEKIIHNLKN